MPEGFEERGEGEIIGGGSEEKPASAYEGGFLGSGGGKEGGGECNPGIGVRVEGVGSVVFVEDVVLAIEEEPGLFGGGNADGEGGGGGDGVPELADSGGGDDGGDWEVGEN